MAKKAAREKSGSDQQVLRIEYESLDELLGRKFPHNPKRHDEDTLDASLAEFDYVDPVVVDEGTGLLVKGHGRLERLEAWRREGKEPPGRIKVEDGRWMVPVVRGVRFKTRKHAGRYLVADNQITMLGGWDSKSLGEIMAAWKPVDLVGVGFTEKDLVQFVSLSGGMGASPPDFPKVGENLATEFCCPKCKHEWSGNPDPLGRLAEKKAKAGAAS